MFYPFSTVCWLRGNGAQGRPGFETIAFRREIRFTLTLKRNTLPD